jgi:hypothetical protein
MDDPVRLSAYMADVDHTPTPMVSDYVLLRILTCH